MAGKKNMGMGSAFQNVKTSGKTRPGTLDAFYQNMKKDKKSTGSKFKKAPASSKSRSSGSGGTDKNVMWSNVKAPKKKK